MQGGVVCGLAVSTEDCHSKGRGFEPRSSSFFSRRKNVRLTKVKPTRREREVAAVQEQREKEEEPAGKSGMDTRYDLVSFDHN